MSSTPGNTAQNPFTPSALNQMLKKHLSAQFNSFWLTGEIFEHYRSPAGHSYFSLKDAQATIKCVMFKQQQTMALQPGMQVMILGQMTVYTPKGDMQVNALRVTEAGQGDLAQQFLLLKEKLAKMGLFDQGRKKPIPQVIGKLGIITSSQGAALQDILRVFIKQNPLLEVTVYHTPVQGAEAPPQINHALRSADEAGHDVLLLTRGGGSKEDLWAFNDEFLAHQLAQLNTPVISAVGHETDESISDLVADLSCITPTAAAHHIAGDFMQLQQNLQHHARLLQLLTQEKIRVFQQRMDRATHQLEKRHPERALAKLQERLTSQAQNLRQGFNAHWQSQQHQWHQLQQRLTRAVPALALHQQRLHSLQQQLHWQMQQQHNQAQQQLALKASELNHQNPLDILGKGYSVTTRLDDGRVVKSASEVNLGDEVATRLKSGRIHAKIFERFDD
jgi:exodeoxyribonuclease VII large subunit